MRRNPVRRIAAVSAVLMLSAAMLFAADSAELYQKFSDAVDKGDVREAVEVYTDLLETSQKEYTKAQRRYEKALDAGNRAKAQSAYNEMRNARVSPITEEQTDALLAAILKEDEAKRSEDAAWLMANSRYYHPMITYSWSSSSDNYSFSYTSSATVTPGEDITLPDESSVKVNTSAAGVLTGWGITPDEVTYQPGEIITAPYTDQTLYAIWTTQVVFKDEVTGFESDITDISSGDEVAVPVLSAPDDSYIFAGWVDRSTGEYIAPEDTETTLEGNGAVFEALWKKAEITALDSKHYDLASIPMNTQIDLTFMLSNIGTEDLRGLTIECTGDEGLKVLNGNGSVSFLGDGNDVMLRGLRAVGTESGNHTLTITVTDRDGDTWSSSFDVTVV